MCLKRISSDRKPYCKTPFLGIIVFSSLYTICIYDAVFRIATATLGLLLKMTEIISPSTFPELTLPYEGGGGGGHSGPSSRNECVYLCKKNVQKRNVVLPDGLEIKFFPFLTFYSLRFAFWKVQFFFLNSNMV